MPIGPEPDFDRIDETRALLRTGNIGADRHRLAADRFDEMRSLRRRGFIDIDDRDGPAIPGQPQRDGTADITTAAGDERHRAACTHKPRS